jgi:hypothetical protein
MGRAEGGLARALPLGTVGASLRQPVPPHRGGLVAALVFFENATMILPEYARPAQQQQQQPLLFLMADDAPSCVVCVGVWLFGCVVVSCGAVLGCVWWVMVGGRVESENIHFINIRRGDR